MQLLVEFIQITCPECNTVWAQTQDFNNMRRNDHKSFYCPGCGSPRYYPKKSDKELLEEKNRWCQNTIESLKYEKEYLERSVRSYKRQITKIRKKVK